MIRAKIGVKMLICMMLSSETRNALVHFSVAALGRAFDS
jgi:hypothetical protein